MEENQTRAAKRRCSEKKSTISLIWILPFTVDFCMLAFALRVSSLRLAVIYVGNVGALWRLGVLAAF